MGTPRANNLQPATSNLKPQTSNLQPPTLNLQPWPLATLREQPATLAFGHATRTTLAKRPRYANNL
ncbi:MAG: hypothetical protein F6J98_06635 [Moorea sp. SIO4G2]|uniref:hypothetical protein n=1 Tax=Moorena TaxID=1155738 RepID=UPI001181727E|nr:MULTISPECIES: hypothetical protein [Moorena]NEO16414.1 hypothetical protein [Moorena sp. SIO3E8]NEO60115.1 hypothetical protein [Moorena sp. SIO4G2]NEQ02767.1 hypothetical protein [Moorena sp. SIO3F7]